MLGIGGKFASSKGMVKMPDLSGLTRADAKTAIANAGLKFGTESSSTNNSGSSFNGDVKTQSIAADTLVEYESTVSFTYYGTYVPPVYLVSTTTSSTSERTSLVYTGYGGATYGDCINGSKTKTTYRFYDETITTTYYTTYNYSDGSSNTVQTGTSSSTSPIEIATDTQVAC